jgi:hypothetical protein
VDLWRCDGLWASSVLAEEPLDLKVLEGKEFGAGDLSGSQGKGMVDVGSWQLPLISSVLKQFMAIYGILGVGLT